MGKFDLPFMNPPEDSPEQKALKERVRKKMEELQGEKRRLFEEAGITEKNETVEQAPERIPTLEEIFSVIKSLTEKETTEVRRLEDEDGVYLLEVTVPGDTENDIEEYSYMRKGRRAIGGGTTMTEIHWTHYIDGFPVEGKEAARFINDEWVLL
ncbi:MAG: hypothetical protein WC693_06400 [Patescibacteria group bacterium]|jgi:hypothetical protein